MLQGDAIDFEQAERVLAGAGACAEAADSHGFLCGLICSAGQADAVLWERELIGSEPVSAERFEQSRELLNGLYQSSQAGLHSDELEFTLLLPTLDQPLKRRIEGLGQWCGGFLAGLSFGGLPVSQQLSPDVVELLEDFAEIARVEFELDQPGEEDEAAFAEILEYVRMGVLVILASLQPSSPINSLH